MEESSSVYLTSIELALNIPALKYLLQQTSTNQTWAPKLLNLSPRSLLYTFQYQFSLTPLNYTDI